MASIENPSSLIYGAGQTTPVGSVSDGVNQRLCVSTVPASGVSLQQSCWGSASLANEISAPLLNGSSANLLVAGTSSAPVVFSYQAGATRATIFRLLLVMSMPSIAFTGTKFSNGNTLGLFAGTLANGLLLGGTTSGTSYTLLKVQINEDLFTCNGGGQVAGGSTGVMVLASVVFNQVLAANSADKITVTVQDAFNSSGVTYAQARVLGILG